MRGKAWQRLLVGLAGVLTLVALYLAFWPLPVAPVVWQVSGQATYSGGFAVNSRLSGLQMVALGTEHGPEHVVARGGWLYIAVDSGAILRIRPDGSGREVVVRTGGRPLGFDFDSQGALVIADPLVSIGEVKSSLMTFSPMRIGLHMLAMLLRIVRKAAK